MQITSAITLDSDRDIEPLLDSCPLGTDYFKINYFVSVKCRQFKQVESFYFFLEITKTKVSFNF